MVKKIIASVVSWILCVGLASAGIPASSGPVGFVNCDGGVTGGMDGEIVRVKDRESFEKAVGDDIPRVVVVEGQLSGTGVNRKKDAIEVGSNKTIVGAGADATLYGIGLNINGKSNIIIRNLTIFDGSPDAIACRDSHHVWVDHCDLGSEHDNEREDWDGLLDFTIGSNYLTASYNRFHDHDKVSICNSGTQHFEDNGKMRVTYHHNLFESTTQRNPRVGYGRGHVFNNYYDSISGYCIGAHSRAKVLSENNYFTAAVKRPFSQMYSDDPTNAYFAELADRGSYFAKSPDDKGKHRLTGTDFAPEAYYGYDFVLDAADTLPVSLRESAGPIAGMERESILYPGNGAMDVTRDVKLKWSPLEDVKSTQVYVGTSADDLKRMPEGFSGNYQTEPSTTYYWKTVTTFSDGSSRETPLYRFTTAPARASNPLPADGDMNVGLYESVSADSFCRPLTLRWTPAFDAVAYKVYVAAGDDELKFAGTSAKPECAIGRLAAGKDYSWRVDVEKSDGNVVQGDVWHFASPVSFVVPGRNEAEKMALSGVAFTEDGSWFSASEGRVSVGDDGPGVLTGVWNGPDNAECNMSVTFYNEKKGAATIAVSLNDRMLDRWVASEDVYELTTHELPGSVKLNKGDEIRIDFLTGGKMRCRIDYITVTPVDATTVIGGADGPTAILLSE